MQPVTGSCLCGSVVYQVDKIEPLMAHCHCSMCRKFHGSAFATFGESRVENFHWVKGESMLSAYVADNGTTRKFCSVCGSSLIFIASDANGEYIEFALGSLDEPIAKRPDAHIFVNYKSDWIALEDDLPKFGEGRDSEVVE
ncbi:MAG: GFA family protein [bacterium]